MDVNSTEDDKLNTVATCEGCIRYTTQQGFAVEAQMEMARGELPIYTTPTGDKRTLTAHNFT